MAQQARLTDDVLQSDRDRRLKEEHVFGAWTWRGGKGSFTFDAGTAEVLLGNPRLAGMPILKDLACVRLEPDGSGRLLAALNQAEEEGPLRVEIRVHSETGERHLEVNGWISGDSLGGFTAAGVVLDPTSCERASSGTEVMTQLAVAAELCSQARNVADALGDAEHAHLIDQILGRLGQALSRESRFGAT